MLASGPAEDRKGRGWRGHPSRPPFIQQPVARTAAVVYILEGLPLYRVRCELGSV